MSIVTKTRSATPPIWISRAIHQNGYRNGTTHQTQDETPTIYYPESDDMPMAENTVQYRVLTTVKENVETLHRDDPDVFVAGDLYWYPVQGQPKIKYAPDVMVVFGRPKGDRGSYMQWVEGHIPPQVIFEIWSPGNHRPEKQKKFDFYEQYGVEEYYTYDPDRAELKGWLRQGQKLQPITQMEGWQSPRLGIWFALDGADLKLSFPNGDPFLTYDEVNQARLRAEAKAEEEAQARKWEAQRANIAEQRADAAEEENRRLAKMLREMGIDPTSI